jgi:intracellular sulfur oxidation DsrE/DsrF family protein
MKSRIRTIAIGIATFLVAALIGYWGAQAFTTDDVQPTVAEPAYEEPVPVVVPVAFEGDVDVAIEQLSEQANASRTIASEMNITLEPTDTSGISLEPVAGSGDGAGGSGSVGSTGTGSPGTTTPSDTAPGDATTPTDAPAPGTGGPSSTPEAGTPSVDGSGLPEERAVDTCADGGDECPEGISGTILAIRHLPDFGVQVAFNPPVPGTGRSVSSPVCPAREAEEGTAYFGVATNRPALIQLEYRTIEFRSDRGGIPWTSVSTATSSAGDAAWATWFASDSADSTDPASWIQTCITLEDLPPRSDYQARFVITDKDDPTIRARTFARLVPFVVTGGDGLVPGAQRRPTTALPLGIDQLFIGLTRTPDQDVAVAARPGNDPAACEIAGDESSIYTGSGTIRSVTTSENTIDAAVLNDASYPYFVEHSVSVVERLDLVEGTDYVVCVYWLDDGPAFDRKVVTESEVIAVSTPEAYRPKIILQRLTNLYGGVERVTVSIPTCSGGITSYDLTEESATVTDRMGSLQTYGPAIELCTIDQRLNDVNRRGIRVDTTIVRADGVSVANSAYIRTDVTCRTTPCLLRLNELVMLPLPDVVAGDGECGTGFGTGCLSGEVSAGDAVIEIRYLASTGSGRANWNIARPTGFDDTPPPLADDPQLAVTTAYELVEGRPENGARATLTFVADRPVTLDVSVMDVFSSGEICSLGPVDGFTSATFSTEYTVTLEPLCLSQGYRLAVTAVDEDGNIADIVGQIPRTDDNTVELYVPPVLLTTEISTTIAPPHEDHSHTVYVRPVRANAFDVTGTGGFDLGGTWPTADRDAAQRAGWQMFGVSGQANACGRPGAGDLEVYARNTGRGVPVQAFMYAAQGGANITYVVDIYANRPVGGTVLRDCVAGELEESVVLQADMSIEDLLAGATLTADSGLVEFTIRATSFRRELGS